MARKKIQPITSLGNEDKLTVQKSLPLFSLWRSELTLAEFKILDIYLSRINSRHPEQRTVKLEKGEIENILGVQRIRTEELDSRLVHLGTPVKIDNSVKTKDGKIKKKFTRISLFEKAVAEQDDHGLWQVELTATQSAMKYFFNIENLGYLRYKLRCITSLTSRYTYIMFMFLESNRFRTPFEVELNELKEILCCDQEETYKEFKRFNDLILKKVQKELNEKTECKYSYEPIKKGRSVVAIRFILKTLPKAIFEDLDPNQITIDDYLEHDLWEDAVKELNFTREQINELCEVLFTVSHSRLPQSEDLYGSIDLMRYHYMQIKVKELLRRDSEEPIKNKFAYLKKMLQSDVV